MQFSWNFGGFKRALGLALVATLVLSSVAGAGTPEALDWLRGQQNPDGGFGEPSAVGATVEALFAITAAGEDVATWQADGNTPLDFLRSHVGEVEGAGPTAKLVLALVAAGADPTDFGGANLVKMLEDSYDSATGRFDGEAGTVPTQALALLALHSVGRPVEQTAIDWLIGAQGEDGSWAWNGDPAEPGDTNTTALAIQALVAVDAQPDAVDLAISYLKSVQNEDAGWPYQNPSEYGTDTDANSTAYAIQALYAAGEDLSDWAVDGTTPLDVLASLQTDNGALQWQAAVPDANFLATVQAVPALAGKAFPLATTTVTMTPAELPATGAAGSASAIVLMLAGLGLAAGGLGYRRLTRHAPTAASRA